MRATIASISVTFDSSIVASCAPSRERDDEAADRFPCRTRAPPRGSRQPTRRSPAITPASAGSRPRAGGRRPERVEHRALETGELAERRLVQRARADALLAALQVDADVDLAARQLVHQHFAQRGFARAHVVRHPEIQVEKARVHGAQFDRRWCRRCRWPSRIRASRSRSPSCCRSWFVSPSLCPRGDMSRRPAHRKARGGKRALSHFADHPPGTPAVRR